MRFYFLAAWLLWIIPAQAAPAANDLFANATVLSGARTGVTNDNNLFASVEAGEPQGDENRTLSNSLWYRWQAPGNGILRAYVATGLDHAVSVYKGTSVNSLQEVVSIGQETGAIEVTAGQWLEIAVQTARFLFSGGGRSGPFDLILEFNQPQPTSSNDAFADAVAITSFPYSFDGNIKDATREPGEPNGGEGNGGPQTLWWSFTPAEEGVLTLSAQSDFWGPRLLAYQGTTLETLTWLSTSDLPMNLHTLPGQRYYFQLTTWPSSGGPDVFKLTASFRARGANDHFSNSIHLEGPKHEVRAWILSPTVEPGEPLDAGAIQGTLWWSWAAPADGRAVITPEFVPTSSPTGGAKFTVYTGPTLDRLTLVPGRKDWQDAPFTFSAQAGVIYHIQVWERSDIEQEPTGFNLELFPFAQATNDNFDQAVPVGGSPKSNLGATREIGEPPHRTGGPNKSLWWKWTAAANGTRAFARIGTAGTITNVTLAVYQGTSVDTLTLIGKGSRVDFDCFATETYYIAAETPEDLIGDIEVVTFSGRPTTSTHEIPGNIVRNGSFEDFSDAGFTFWSGEMGGAIWETGPDGRNYVIFGMGHIHQDLDTIAGQSYRLRFVYLNAQGFDTEFSIKINGALLDRIVLPLTSQQWLAAEYVFTAPAAVTRLEFRGVKYSLAIDQISAVRLSQPPLVVNEPQGITTFAGATATFHVGLTGAEPMTRQWYFNDEPIPGATKATLSLTDVSPAHAGLYHLTAHNAFGSIESRRATLTVENAASPQLVFQPQSDVLFSGQHFVLQAAAVGTPPLRYQWFRDSTPIANATESSLTFTAFGSEDTGLYTVKVSNAAESVISLPASLTLAETAEAGGGVVRFANSVGGFASISAPIFDVDGVTRLSGSNFVAQLYVGLTPDLLRPVGEPRPFLTGFLHGFWSDTSITLPHIASGVQFFAQARVWEKSAGGSYETARALGGKFGRGKTLHLIAGYGNIPPRPGEGTVMEGLGSFQLQAGFSGFITGRLSLLSTDENSMQWQLTGAAGFRYLVERQTDGSNWGPFKTLTNETGAATFSDQRDTNATIQLYRARMLD